MTTKDTQCVHSGAMHNPIQPGAVSPVVLATAQPYLDVENVVYPRYFNLPNQLVVANKIKELEQAEDALVFGSGMAAISTSLLSQLKTGDHAVFQNSIYGGTKHMVLTMFDNLGIEYSFTAGTAVTDFEALLQANTRLIYIESPSNPLLQITDIKGIAQLAKASGILTAIDSTFASPILQNPFQLGIDLVLHSATKYLGGHSDICAGVVAGSKEKVDQIRKYARCLGGSLDGNTSYLLERSIKTLSTRVEKQTANALKIATELEKMPGIRQVLYPGLPSHPQHELARQQMRGFGAMIAFELENGADPIAFQKQLKIIAPTVSLGGVESTICSPYLTSHCHFPKVEREKMGISDELLRLSVGIESAEDLLQDITQALKPYKKRNPGPPSKLIFKGQTG